MNRKAFKTIISRAGSIGLILCLSASLAAMTYAQGDKKPPTKNPPVIVPKDKDKKPPPPPPKKDGKKN